MDLNKFLIAFLSTVALVLFVKTLMLGAEIKESDKQIKECVASLNLIQSQSNALTKKVEAASKKNIIISKSSNVRHHKLTSYSADGCVKTARWAQSQANDISQAFVNLK